MRCLRTCVASVGIIIVTLTVTRYLSPAVRHPQNLNSSLVTDAELWSQKGVQRQPMQSPNTQHVHSHPEQPTTVPDANFATTPLPSGLDRRSVRSVTRYVRRARFLLLIGDDADESMVKGKCSESQGARDFFVQVTSKRKEWASLKNTMPLKSRHGVGACFLQSNVVLGFIFNPFGVQPYGPWHTDLGEFYDQYYRNVTHNLDPIAAFKNLLVVQIHDMLKLVGVLPEVVSVASSAWDSGRMGTRSPEQWRQIVRGGQEMDAWLAEWKANATRFLHALALEFPGSVFAWRLSTYSTNIPGYPESLTNRVVVKRINAAACEMASALNSTRAFNNGLRVIDLPNSFPELQGQCNTRCDAPTAQVSLCFADHLIATFFRDAGLANASKSCLDARGTNACTYSSLKAYRKKDAHLQRKATLREAGN